ncbi:MAG TPA: RidA family protein [Chloroflexota bacterium]|jgi:enamine deaminase RidA (YjgF/YER057c/UK114 family)|nr:RidA family protein [Chloroflexota bacterium]
MTPEERLRELSYTLPTPPPPIGTYVGAVRTGNLLFLSGKGPTLAGGKEWRGKLGAELSTEEGYQAARDTMLNLLAVLRAELGELSRVQRVVKLLGMVNSTPEFDQQPKVINGASDLLVDVFGERGRHARSAVGMAALPNGIPVEIEMIVEVSD